MFCGMGHSKVPGVLLIDSGSLCQSLVWVERNSRETERKNYGQ